MDQGHADVLIVGAGASGAVAARRLTDAGISVVCLEQGDWPDRANYPGATAEWELVAGKQWSSVPGIRNAVGDYPVDLAESDLGIVNFNGVGGGTVLYAAQWPRMLPDDFRVRSVDGLADDWPIGYEDLLPFYERADREFGVSGLGGNPAYPPGEDPPLPPLPIGAAGLRVARAHARLGWHWWPQANAILSAPYEGRHACVQRGTCTSGCNEGAKASTDLTHWPHVIARGGRLITGARVRRLLTDSSGLVAGAEWIDREGREHRQSADVVVCAANAIGTARLLLASADSRCPAGLANSSGLVGRRLMLHPLFTVTGLFEEQLEGWQAHAGGLIQCLQFARSEPSRGFVRGALWELGSAGGPMKATFAPLGTGVWGPDHHRHVRERLGRTATWAVLCEDLPEESNRVELSPTIVDSSGIAAPKLCYRLGDNTQKLMRWQADRARESLEAAGAWKVEVVTHVANGHFMGTARMGDDPGASVTDRWGVAHDVKNLLMVDGSVFVTAGAANPTSTICALALRAIERLIDHRDEIPLPRRSSSFAGFAATAGVAGGAATSADGTATVQLVVPAELSPTQRERLRALADELIPAADGMPSASDAGVSARGVDRVLVVRPDLAAPLRAVLDAAGGEPAAVLAHLDAQDKPGLRALRYVVAGAYYLDAGVRERLAYPGTQPRPVRTLDFPEYLTEGLLDHLLTA